MKQPKQIKLKAFKLNQGYPLYMARVSVDQLLTDGFFTVRRLNPKDPETGEYQRNLEPARVQKIKNYILDAIQKKGDPFMPGTMFLATEETLAFDGSHIQFETNPEEPIFNIVDGQHRANGFVHALEGARANPKKYTEDHIQSILQFELAIILADNMPMSHQGAHFIVINHSQRKVDGAVLNRVANHINSQFCNGNQPTIPADYRKLIRDNNVGRAIEIVEELNSNPDSPWHNRIALANDKEPKGKAAENGFRLALQEKMLRKVRNKDLKENNRLLAKSQVAYWRAIVQTLGCGTLRNANSSVRVFSALFPIIASPLEKEPPEERYTSQKFEDALAKCFANLDDENKRLGEKKYWDKAIINFTIATAITTPMLAAAHGMLQDYALQAMPRTEKEATKEELYGRQQGKCAICKMPKAFDDLQIDHIDPKSNGGEDAPHNYRLLCQACNKRAYQEFKSAKEKQ